MNIIRIIGRWWWFLLSLAIISGATTYFFIRDWPPTYQSTVKVFVSQGVNSSLVNVYDINSADRAVKTVGSLINSDSILQDLSAATSISVLDLHDSINVHYLTNTQIIELDVTEKNIDLTSRIADNIFDITTKYLASIQKDNDEKSRINIALAEPPSVPTQINAYFVAKTTAFASIFALIFAYIIVYLIEYFDRTIRSGEDLLGMKINHLGDFAILKKMSKSPFAGIGGHNQSAAEMLREIRTNITYFEADEKLKVIEVTSANPREGKTIFISNLALMLADSGKKTVLVDADMRSPFVHKIYKTENDKGLTNYLQENVKIGDLIVKTEFENLYLLPAGQPIANPSELLTDEKLKNLRTRLSDDLSFDYILIDTPPVGIITDGAVISTVCDGVVIVVQKEKTTQQDTLRLKEALTRVGAHIIGAVITGVKDNKRIYYYSEDRKVS